MATNPPLDILSIEDVRLAARKAKKEEPIVSSGQFVCIGHKNVPVYIFRNHITTSCTDASKADSVAPALPAPLSVMDVPNMSELFQQSSILRVGADFLYGTSIQYEIKEDNSVVFPDGDKLHDFLDVTPEPSEAERNAEMASAIRQYMGGEFSVRSLAGKGDQSGYTEFSGGGDIFMHNKNPPSNGLVVVTQEREENEEEEGMDKNEEEESDEDNVCFGLAIENKLSSATSEQKTIRRLKASIMILFSILLRKCIKHGCYVDQICICGITFGPTIPISILKCVMNFERTKFTAEQQLRLKVTPLHSTYFDALLTYILKLMK